MVPMLGPFCYPCKNLLTHWQQQNVEKWPQTCQVQTGRPTDEELPIPDSKAGGSEEGSDAAKLILGKQSKRYQKPLYWDVRLLLPARRDVFTSKHYHHRLPQAKWLEITDIVLLELQRSQVWNERVRGSVHQNSTKGKVFHTPSSFLCLQVFPGWDSITCCLPPPCSPHPWGHLCQISLCLSLLSMLDLGLTLDPEWSFPKIFV